MYYESKVKDYTEYFVSCERKKDNISKILVYNDCKYAEGDKQDTEHDSGNK